MKNKQRGFAPIAVVLILLGVIAIGGGGYFYVKQKNADTERKELSPSASQELATTTVKESDNLINQATTSASENTPIKPVVKKEEPLGSTPTTAGCDFENINTWDTFVAPVGMLTVKHPSCWNLDKSTMVAELFYYNFHDEGTNLGDMIEKNDMRFSLTGATGIASPSADFFKDVFTENLSVAGYPAVMKIYNFDRSACLSYAANSKAISSMDTPENYCQFFENRKSNSILVNIETNFVTADQEAINEVRIKINYGQNEEFDPKKVMKKILGTVKLKQ